MRRREVIAMLGAAGGAWPLAARAQQPAMPVVGFLNGYSPEDRPYLLAAFKQGLSETGYVEGRTVAIEYRWAGSQMDRLPAFAAELVQRHVDVIVTCGGEAPAQAAKAATQLIPIVGLIGGDPVASGLVGSINRPGGNFTGVSLFANLLLAKRAELLHELVPAAATIALLVDATQPEAEASNAAVVRAALQKLGVQTRVLTVSSVADLDGTFAALAKDRISGLLVSSFPFWDTIPIRGRLVVLAANYGIATGFYDREQAEGGGLMSYGPSVPGAYRQLGAYAARVLKGDKPSDLPVQQPTTFDLVINLKTAKALGLTIPPSLFARAEVVIE